MLEMYKRMEREGKIGPFDAEGRPRPWQEFPKQVRTADGGRAIVQSAREELAIAANASPSPNAADDPLVAEKRRLEQENQDLRLQLAALAQSKPAAQAPSVMSPKAPALQVAPTVGVP